MIGPWIDSYFFLALTGASQGAASSILSALWVEKYGREALGSIKSVVAMTGVLSTAASPILFGMLLDVGVGYGQLIQGCLGLGLVAIGCTHLAARRDRGTGWQVSVQPCAGE